jgi:hypothetical protein
LASISASILCDFAQVREGLLFVASGGITRAYRPELPAPLMVMLGLLVEIPADEQGRVHEIEIVVKHNDTATDIARVVAGAQAAGDTHPGESLMVPAVADLRMVGVAEYGSYDVRVNVDGNPGTYLTFYVLDKPPDMPANAPPDQ